MTKQEYEAIVVGSGATGGIAAHTLAKSGIKVLIVDIGKILTPKVARGTEPCNTFKRVDGIISNKHKNQSQHPGYWKSNPLLYRNEKLHPYYYPEKKPFIWTQGNQLGGRSLTWGGITLRLSDDEFKAGKHDGESPSWPLAYKDLASHYSYVEGLFQIYGNIDKLSYLPDGKYQKALPLTASENYFSSALRKSLKLPLINSRGFGPYEPSEAGEWPLFSSNGTTLPLAMATGNAEILSNHMVEKLVLDNQTKLAKGIIAIDLKNGSRSRINAKLIVLCASTIQTLRILLNSKDNSNNTLIDPSNKLGYYLMDHISVCRFFSLESKSHNNYPSNKLGEHKLSGAGSFFIPLGSRMRGFTNTDFKRGYGIWGAIDRFEPPNFLKKFPSTKTGFLIAHGEVLPNKKNRVTLSEKIDRWGVPSPHIECEWGENEVKMSNHMKRTISEIISACGGEMLSVNELFKIDLLNPFLKSSLAFQEDAPPPGYYIHEVGGAAMGNNEINSVVDKWNRLWRYKNVLVTDGSCWPTSGWQSPTLTMMAITHRACSKAINSPL